MAYPSKKIAHLADLHFDIQHLDDALNSFNFAINEAVDQQCDATVLAGDIWDRSITADDKSPFNQVVDAVQRLSLEMPVVVVYGNHDRPGSLTIFERIGITHRITVASSPEKIVINGIVFSLFPYPTKAFLLSQRNESQDETDLIAGDAMRKILAGFAATSAERKDCPHVLVFHGNVTGCKVESGQTVLGGDVMVSASDLEMSGADYVALGHIHAAQRMGNKCFYPGSLYHCDFGELEPKYMNVVEVWSGGFEVEQVRLPSRQKIVLEHLKYFSDTAWAIEIARNKDVKVRVRLSEEEARTFDDSALSPLRDVAHSLFVERIITPRERIRCEAIADVTRLRDKVLAWGESVNLNISESVKEKADELEVIV